MTTKFAKYESVVHGSNLKRRNMRNSKTLKKIHQNRCARVCGLGHYLPFFVRYAAHFGYDVIWLDLEHRAMTDREVQSLLGL